VNYFSGLFNLMLFGCYVVCNDNYYVFLVSFLLFFTVYLGCILGLYYFFMTQRPK
jgi:uncharacterized Tic20 family protein